VRRRWRIPDTSLVQNLGLLAALVLWLAFLYVVAQLLAGTALANVFRSALVLWVPAFGLVRWIRVGHGWLATLSWTLPLAAWLLLLEFADGPLILRGAGIVVTIIFGVLLAMEPEAAEWWYVHILRSTPPVEK
jgi:hypothetical protein